MRFRSAGRASALPMLLAGLLCLACDEEGQTDPWNCGLKTMS